MNVAMTGVVIALGWALATGNFSLGNLLFGGLVAAAGLWVVRDRLKSGRVLRKTRRILALCWLFTIELFLSAIRVAVLVLRPNMKAHLKPGIVSFPLTAKGDAEITLLANMITLTPGTLSVDVSEDRKYLYIHAINVPDPEALIREIADGFERRVIEVFQ